MLTTFAYAKVNLTLEVIGECSNGYHRISSVMQAIDLCDILSFQPAKTIRLGCNIPGLASPDNLVLRAAELLRRVTGSSHVALISLNKAIPTASGLGGGSSDAAAALRALNKLWELDLSCQSLRELAQELGSDVAFFLGDSTALVEGRGEKVIPLPPSPKCWLVLLKPPITVPFKTRGIYARLNQSHFTSGESSARVVKLLKQGEGISSSLYYNTFEKVAFSFFPRLEQYWEGFLAAGAASVHLVGAGPTLFTLAESRTQGEDIYSRLVGRGEEAYLVQTPPPGFEAR